MSSLVKIVPDLYKRMIVAEFSLGRSRGEVNKI